MASLFLEDKLVVDEGRNPTMVGAALKNRCFFDAVPKIVKP